MQALDAADKALIQTRCATCIYLSSGGRCQRIKSRFYAEKIAFPDDFACSRWERFGVSEKRRAEKEKA